jgi:hypothetical protein
MEDLNDMLKARSATNGMRQCSIVCILEGDYLAVSVKTKFFIIVPDAPERATVILCE